jgi:REP element-mobilizing transposase RayT
MDFPGRPRRLEGFDYRAAGPVFHCRFSVAAGAEPFRDPRTANLVVGTLEHHHARTAHILAFCVMPDHVHVLLSLRSEERTLSRWVGDVKRWVSRQAGNDGIRVGWQKGFFERVLRTQEDLLATARYIVANPVRAGIVASPSYYPWCGSFEWDLLDERRE